MTVPGYTIRQFTAEEMPEYRAIRLEALRLEPGMFGNSYAMEEAMADAEWLERLTNPLHARFGLFYNDELVGLTAIIADAADPDIAYMTQSYISKEHRGRGLSRMLYSARISWAQQNGVKKLTIGHRANNLASKAANQHYGFAYTHSESRLWPDGATEDMLYYELGLKPRLKVLFVCTINRMRSATAAVIFADDPRFEVRSAGTDREARVVLTEELLQWADAVVVMEKHHRNHIQRHFAGVYASKKIVCLYIPDEYDYMQDELIALLKGKVEDVYGRGLLGYAK